MSAAAMPAPLDEEFERKLKLLEQKLERKYEEAEDTLQEVDDAVQGFKRQCRRPSSKMIRLDKAESQTDV